jgi:citrate synthase
VKKLAVMLCLASILLMCQHSPPAKDHNHLHPYSIVSTATSLGITRKIVSNYMEKNKFLAEEEALGICSRIRHMLQREELTRPLLVRMMWNVYSLFLPPLVSLLDLGL